MSNPVVVHSFRRQGLTFPVTDAGPPDGATVILLHGFPQDAATFSGVVPLLHAAGVRTLVPLQRGYADTARPRRRREYRLSLLVDDVVALADAAGAERVHLVGHDWGAAVGWAMAAARPDRTASLTALSVPHPAALAWSLIRSRQALMSAYIGYFQLPGLPEMTLRRSLPDLLTRSGLPVAVARRYADAMHEPGALTAALHWYRALPLALGWGPGRVDVPTTFVWGCRDAALGEVAAAATARYVRGPYRFLDLDAGHWLPETEPATVAAAVVQRVASAP